MHNNSRQKGLTLIEVLVSIAILSGAVGALIVLMATQTRGAVALADRANARVAAENAMVAVVIGEAEGVSPSGAQTVGTKTFAWSATRTAAPVPGLQTITVTVREEDGAQVIATLSTLADATRRDE